MKSVTLEEARTIVATALSRASEMNLKPMAVVVLDARGSVKACECQDGASAMRFKIAHGKAYGAYAMGLGSRSLFNRAQEQPYFIGAMNELAGGALVPVPGGVLVRDADGGIAGAVGMTGDTSDNDETCVVAGIEAAGYAADTGG